MDMLVSIVCYAEVVQQTEEYMKTQQPKRPACLWLDPKVKKLSWNKVKALETPRGEPKRTWMLSWNRRESYQPLCLFAFFIDKGT